MPALSLRPPVVGELRLAVPVVLLVITMLAIFFQRRSAVAAYLAGLQLAHLNAIERLLPQERLDFTHVWLDTGLAGNWCNPFPFFWGRTHEAPAEPVPHVCGGIDRSHRDVHSFLWPHSGWRRGVC
jgi:hypothetical protein